MFVLATSDYVEFVLLPPLLKRLAREAPGVRLEVRPWGLQQVPKSLQSGEVDLMIGFYDEVPAHHAETLLFDEHYVCIARKEHPGLGRKPTLKSWLAQKHVLVSQQGNSPGTVDRALAARDLKRTIGARVSHFLLVPTLVAQTDLVAAVNARVATAFAESLEPTRICAARAAAQGAHRPSLARATRTRSGPTLVPPADRRRVPQAVDIQ